MGSDTSVQTQAFPPPHQGQRDDIPLAALQNPYAQYVTNYNLHTGVPTLRRGEQVWTATSGKPTESFVHLCVYGAGTTAPFLF